MDTAIAECRRNRNVMRRGVACFASGGPLTEGAPQAGFVCERDAGHIGPHMWINGGIKPSKGIPWPRKALPRLTFGEAIGLLTADGALESVGPWRRGMRLPR